MKEVSGANHVRVEHDFGDGYVRLHVSEAERRQAAQDIHCSENILLELLRNAKDARAAHIFVALNKEADIRAITVIDDGDGVPASMHKHIFEPRVTSKLETSHKDAWGFHGRGMALYSIAENSQEAYVAASHEGLGTSIRVLTDTRKLPERTDQSSFPVFEISEGTQVNVRGPRNLLRCACEFALDARSTSHIYVGSPSGIAATLYRYGETTLSAIDRAFCKDVLELPLVKRLAVSRDPAEFASIASSLGLELSERTARRIMDGQIEPEPSILDQIELVTPQSKQTVHHASIKKSRLKLQNNEIEALLAANKGAFSSIADSYYLEANVQPQLRVSSSAISISIPIVPRTEPLEATE